MDSELVVEVAEGVATVTLNRPRARNALNATLRSALRQAMGELDADGTVRAIILTGADPAFCAGLDLKELAGSPGSLSSGFSGDGGFSGDMDLRMPIPGMSTPLIGAVNGVAITGGLELALACDFLVASEQARFADTHARVGIMPGWGLTVQLAEAIGLRRARELSATGNFLGPGPPTTGDSSTTSSDTGPAHLARALAADIAGNDPTGVVHVLDTYRIQAKTQQTELLEVESTRSAEWLRSRGPGDLEDRRKAVTQRGRGQI
ncbi:MAG: enoyl-CoA hydratase [Microthrixaceae bacterium]|nr:enoyl-CoA hydratase [Microthrixaceae bacterium]